MERSIPADTEVFCVLLYADGAELGYEAKGLRLTGEMAPDISVGNCYPAAFRANSSAPRFLGNDKNGKTKLDLMDIPDCAMVYEDTFYPQQHYRSDTAYVYYGNQSLRPHRSRSKSTSTCTVLYSTDVTALF